MTMRVVSVIVPCRHERDHIEAFCRSVAAQTLPEGWALEVLVASMPHCAARIQIMGTVGDPQRLLAASDLAVVPSESSEAFGLVAVEAMACELPTLVSDAGILPTIVGEGAGNLVFRQGSVEGLAALLQYWLLNTEARRLCGPMLRERAVRLYDASLCGASYEREMLASLPLVE